MAIEVVSIDDERRRPNSKPRANKGVAIKLVPRPRKRRMLRRCVLAAVVLIVAAATIFFIYSYRHYARIVDARLKAGYLTSRAGIYAAPRTLRAGQTLSQSRLVELLRRAGYLESDASDVWSGSFTAQDQLVEIRPRNSAASSPGVVRVRFDGMGRIAEITADMGVTLDAYVLEPEMLTTDSLMKTSKRAQLSYRDIPPVLARAILSIEDRRFFEHSGVDIWGVGRALWRNTTDDESSQGGSTITQQLVKNTFLTPERSMRRKFAEAMTALALERRLSKEDIFALYCNEIYLGQRGALSVRGVAQAAHIYFGKELKDLSLAESATIAGLIQSPNHYAPDLHPQEATARRNTVLGTMLRDQFITHEEARAASQEVMMVAPLDPGEGSTAPYFIDYVNRLVESKLSAANNAGGLRIHTTIDLDLQQLAETAISRQLDRLDGRYRNREAKPQAALVAIDPKTGDVLAMVGGRNYAESQLNRATDARRQPGSVFKPIVYSAALERGLSPLDMYADAPQEFIYAGNARYRPSNYGGGFSMREVMLRTGLVRSLNVVTVDIAMRTGLARVASTAENFGLPRAEPYPALALGTTEATPLAVASAYTAFANHGERVEPNVIAHVSDSSGTELLNEIPQTRPVISPNTAYMITDMLSDVIDRGTAHAARGAVKGTAIAGKTGTSRDGWFVGYTPNLVVAVWIGFDDNRQLGLTGAEAALPAWTEFVSNAVETRPDLGGKAFERPSSTTFVEIDPDTGLLATAACPRHEQVAILATLAPNLECTTHGETIELPDWTEESDDSGSLISSVSPRAQSKPTSHPAAAVERMESPLRSTTRVETDTRGQRTLVNDMRISTLRIRP